MTILETIVALLALHGVDGSGYDRIDVALEKLYQVEMSEKSVAAPKNDKKKSPASKPSVEEEPMGI